MNDIIEENVMAMLYEIDFNI